jgi:hypothetical protein
MWRTVGMEGPQNTKNGSTMGSSYPISGYIPKRNEISISTPKRHLYAMSVASLFTIAGMESM